ncbi:MULTISPECIES: helix-turn-helix domain-containing protein [Chryseobacterium]|uniref:helix-turn-helix domain-containing protein n=1 Tax=Chryseobacterium TaxID=59732 RepID=UPI001555BB5D|nr:helix-turn-helix domain-containing protein [Chryseobacterium sp. LAM-KRS1]
MEKYSNISLHHRQLQDFGIKLMPLSVLSEKETGIHRDDHYMFILQQKGDFTLEVDFNTLDLKGAFLCFVAPGQIHRYVHQQDTEGWFLFVDTGAIPQHYREVLETYQWIRQSVEVNERDVVFDIPGILEKIDETDSLHTVSVKQSLVESVIGMMVSQIMKFQVSEQTSTGQKYTITRQFKKLVKENFKKIKQVQQYAQSLVITPLYLNEAIKEVTGYPASYWIQQEVLLEARRLLFYTKMSVKQIAVELGYDDPVYFSRFFKKGTGMTALQFRSHHKDLSHKDH